MRANRVTWIAALVCVLWCHASLPAATDPPDSAQDANAGQTIDEILGGFDEDAATPDQDTRDEQPTRFRMAGLLKLGASYNIAHDAPTGGETDWRGLSRLRPEFHMELETRLTDSWRLFVSGFGSHDLAFSVQDRESYTEEVLDTYEQDLELGESYLAGRLSRRVGFKVGRQVVAWGTSETLRITDVLNPLDLREPGLTDIENLRLPLTMTRLDVQLKRWSLTGIALHERRFHKNPVVGHDFFPLPLPLPAESVPANSLANTELAAAARGFFRGWDLSFFWAQVYDDVPHLGLTQFGQPELRHSRLNMVGAAWDFAAGDYVIKAEAAHFRGLEYFNAPGTSFSRSELMAGFEYSGLTDTSFTFEVVGRRLHGFVGELERFPDLANEEELDWVVRATRTFLRQTLTVTLVAVTLGATGDGGALQRLECRYDLSDAVEISGGVVLYQSGTRSGFESIGDNDRLFLELAYRF